MITAWYDKLTETFFELYAPLMVSVNPYIGEVVANRFWGETATTRLLDLHTQLRLDRFGWNAVGVLGLLLLVSCGTGLYLWWQGIRGIGQALKVRQGDSMMQLAFDLHRLLGVFSGIALFVLAFIGILLSYPSVLEILAGSSGMEHGQTGRIIISTAIPNNHPTGLAAASFVDQRAFQKTELRRVTVPLGNSEIYHINFRQRSENNQRHPFTTVWVDRWSGQSKDVHNPAKFSKGEIFASWIWPLHTGEALGAPGRFAGFLAGLSLFVLYVSGLLGWLCKSGKIRDRKVNFAALRPLLYRMRELIYWSELGFFMLIRLLAHKATGYVPYIRTGYDKLLGLAGRMCLTVIDRQKRIGNIEKS